MRKSAEYVSSAYSFIYTYPLDKLLDFGYQSKEGDPIPSFDEELLINLCSEAEQIFEKEKNILELDGDLIIVGDIHGSLHDLLRILKYIHEKNTKVLFLGDYVDRGNFSLECITILFSMKILYPNQFYLLRGNHEFDSICSQYGFKSEILNHHIPKKIENPNNKNINQKIQKSNSLLLPSLSLEEECETDYKYEDYYSDHKGIHCYKYSETLYNAFIKAFSYLPIAAIVNKQIFCIHGGLTPRLKNIEQINSINRPIDTFEESPLLTDVVWGDPAEDSECRFSENPRGRGYIFNCITVCNFLADNSLKKIIRAHQCVLEGSLSQFFDKCVTVFSASSYDRPMGNSSAILHIILENDQFKTIEFYPIERLSKKDALYYKVQPLNSNEEKNHKFFSLTHPSMDPRLSIKIKSTKNYSKVRYHNSTSSLPHSSRKLCSYLTPRLNASSSNVSKYFDPYMNENAF